jgi:SAM-dependent methyltransferase
VAARIVDYDTPGYDYRDYWQDRDYEQWSEGRILDRTLPLLGRPRWFVDLGGGYGRNAAYYRRRCDNYVIADYSATNLGNAARLLRDDVATGRAVLVRCDLLALPFVDAAFDAGLVVRVLHHVTDIDRGLAEMGRVIGDRWLLDVPIKHHALAMLRSATPGRWRAARAPQPRVTGHTEHAFRNFQLASVRRTLHGLGWDTTLAASANNLRRWDRGHLPTPLVRALQPGARLVDAAAQRCGRGWWGPNQFVLARRARPRTAQVTAAVPCAPALSGRMACPACRGVLHWAAGAATCGACHRWYPRADGYWDFTVPEG